MGADAQKRRGLERPAVWVTLELKLEPVVSHLMGMLGVELGPSERAVLALNHRAICLQPIIIFLIQNNGLKSSWHLLVFQPILWSNIIQLYDFIHQKWMSVKWLSVLHSASSLCNVINLFLHNTSLLSPVSQMLPIFLSTHFHVLYLFLSPLPLTENKK